MLEEIRYIDIYLIASKIKKDKASDNFWSEVIRGDQR